MSKSTHYQGHHESIVRVHATRTAARDAAFLLPHLQLHMKILDVGCGPGSITAGFCHYVPQGSVVGVDASPDVIEKARDMPAARELGNLTFQTGNVMDGLSYEDDSFDVVYCHQLLFHLPDPTAALREMKRVCKPGGLVACREADFPGHWYPSTDGLVLWEEMFRRMVWAGGADPAFRGLAMPAYARRAGFDPAAVQKSVSTMSFSTPEERAHVAGSYVDRIEKSDVGRRFREVGATEDQLALIVRALRGWSEDSEGWHEMLESEIICRA